MVVTRITLKPHGAAFEDGCGWEVARILRDLAQRLDGNQHAQSAGYSQPSLDRNGDEAGYFGVYEE